MRLINRVWHTFVNTIQWYNYAKTWLNILFNMLTITSSVSILLIFFNAERSIETLIILNLVVFGGSIIIGNLLFRSKAQQVDIIMQQWRSPYFALAATTVNMAILEVAKKENITIPTELSEWGINQWDDILKIYKYSLEKGKEAQAMEICKGFFNSP